jgi:hypothetical protein
LLLLILLLTLPPTAKVPATLPANALSEVERFEQDFVHLKTVSPDGKQAIVFWSLREPSHADTTLPTTPRTNSAVVRLVLHNCITPSGATDYHAALLSEVGKDGVLPSLGDYAVYRSYGPRTTVSVRAGQYVFSVSAPDHAVALRVAHHVATVLNRYVAYPEDE